MEGFRSSGTLISHFLFLCSGCLLPIFPSFLPQIAKNVSQFPSRHTLLPVQNPFIVPGGRFREYYYWDTFWIIEGKYAHGPRGCVHIIYCTAFIVFPPI